MEWRFKVTQKSSSMKWQFYQNPYSIHLAHWEPDEVSSMTNTGIIQASLCLKGTSCVSHFFQRIPRWITSSRPRPLAIDPVGALGKHTRWVWMVSIRKWWGVFIKCTKKKGVDSITGSHLGLRLAAGVCGASGAPCCVVWCACYMLIT